MRFYNNELPKKDDITMCRVTHIDDTCIYVSLLEYDNIEGMVQLADASTRRKKRSICLLKKDRTYPLLVLSIDEEKKYVDLSNKFLTEEDKSNYQKKYDDYHVVLKILKSFLSAKFERNYNEENYIEYAQKTIWKLKPYKSLAFLADNPDLSDFDLTIEEQQIFKAQIVKHLGEYKITNEMKFQFRNLDFDGINKTKTIFDDIKKNYGLTVMLNVAPEYYVRIESDNEENNNETLNAINNALDSEKALKNYNYQLISFDRVC